MGKNVTVRNATQDDLEWILDELEKFSKFTKTHYPLFESRETAKELLSQHIQNHVFMVAERDGESLGFVSGLLINHVFNPKIVCLQETFWWVKEEHRGSRAGLTLINEFVKIGKEKAHWILCSLEHVSPVNDRVLLNRGFYLHEKQYLHEVING